MSERPRIEDSYTTAVRSLRLMQIGDRHQQREGSDLLASLGLEAVPVLALIAQQAVTGVAVLAGCATSDVFDEMTVQNIEQTEELDDE